MSGSNIKKIIRLCYGAPMHRIYAWRPLAAKIGKNHTQFECFRDKLGAGKFNATAGLDLLAIQHLQNWNSGLPPCRVKNKGGDIEHRQFARQPQYAG